MIDYIISKFTRPSVKYLIYLLKKDTNSWIRESEVLKHKLLPIKFLLNKDKIINEYSSVIEYFSFSLHIPTYSLNYIEKTLLNKYIQKYKDKNILKEETYNILEKYIKNNNL